eukprot:scaffold250293_cov17-Prasinocladus_malaysianus.AAC.1
MKSQGPFYGLNFLLQNLKPQNVASDAGGYVPLSFSPPGRPQDGGGRTFQDQRLWGFQQTGNAIASKLMGQRSTPQGMMAGRPSGQVAVAVLKWMKRRRLMNGMDIITVSRTVATTGHVATRWGRNFSCLSLERMLN